MAFETDFEDVGQTRGIFQVHIHTKEVNEVVNALGFALKNMQDEPIPREIMEIIGHNTVEFAKGLAPIRTSRLHDSINYHIRGSSGRETLEVFATAENLGYPYGASIEYGFHPHGGDYFVPPMPFLRPALEYATLLTKETTKEIAKNQLILYNDGKSAHYGPWFDKFAHNGLMQNNGFKLGSRSTMTRTTASRSTIQNSYLRTQHSFNQMTRRNGPINTKTAAGRAKYDSYSRNGKFTKGAYKQTTWGGGRRGKVYSRSYS